MRVSTLAGQHESVLLTQAIQELFHQCQGVTADREKMDQIHSVPVKWLGTEARAGLGLGRSVLSLSELPPYIHSLSDHPLLISAGDGLV